VVVDPPHASAQRQLLIVHEADLQTLAHSTRGDRSGVEDRARQLRHQDSRRPRSCALSGGAGSLGGPGILGRRRAMAAGRGLAAELSAQQVPAVDATVDRARDGRGVLARCRRGLALGFGWCGQLGEVERVPATLRRTPAEQVAPVPPVVIEDLHDPPPREPSLPVQWVDGEAELAVICERLRLEDAIALDVETTFSRTLCLVQLGTREQIYILDALELSDLAPLGKLLGDAGVIKIIHNASFEKGVLRRYGIEIANIVDTLALSRERYSGRVIDGGHKLGEVCQRELGIDLYKTEQTSNWARRPLSRRQLAYAALDVEVLPLLWDRLQTQGRLL
jgi:hypothetical protein